MVLKKNLRNPSGQVIVEYVLIFIVLVAGIIAVFLAFNPEHVTLKGTFNQAVTDSINAINQ
ncbi:MAG: hypothetical protein WCY12_02555 [Candidatus Omnitrophota bacterium]|jgi:hypothetical protein